MYYGASYGSQLGQHVMRDFPGILEAVVLDGAGPFATLFGRSVALEYVRFCEIVGVPSLPDGVLNDHWSEQDVARALRNSDEYRSRHR